MDNDKELEGCPFIIDALSSLDDQAEEQSLKRNGKGHPNLDQVFVNYFLKFGLFSYIFTLYIYFV